MDTKTPEQKGDELIQKFRLFVGTSEGDEGQIINNYLIGKKQACKCAIIAVEEIITANPSEPSSRYGSIYDQHYDAREFWDSVLNYLKTKQ